MMRRQTGAIRQRPGQGIRDVGLRFTRALRHGFIAALSGLCFGCLAHVVALLVDVLGCRCLFCSLRVRWMLVGPRSLPTVRQLYPHELWL